MKDFRKLVVWRKAHAVTLAVYRATATFPRKEQFGLTAQVRRACVLIAANIAEGCGRQGEVEFRRFLRIAMGSASELEYHLLLSHELALLPAPAYRDLAEAVVEVKHILASLIRRVGSES